MYTGILITVTLGEKPGTLEFQYELDNEICPEITVPDTWKQDCTDAGKTLALIDQAFPDPFADNPKGLKAIIASFDECYPADYQSGKKYARFQKAVRKGLTNMENLKKISLQVYSREDESIIDECELIFSE